jgi:serine/threonine protein kinase
MYQRGGKLVGQGVFGCTFDPAPPCAGGHVFKKISGLPAVGKLTSDDVKDELGIGKKIMSLPLATQYFALPTATCKAGDPAQDPEAKGCRVLNESGQGTRFSLLIMPMAGKQLIKMAENLPRLAANFEHMFRHLLEGMIIYQKAGIIHNDIHMGNILVDDNDVARYIDFGLGFRIDDIKTWADTNMGKRFRPKYNWTPPEVHAWRMVRNGVWLADGVKQLQAINSEYMRLEHQFPNRVGAYDALKSFLESAPKDSGEFIRMYAKKFDCWRIGLCMWLLWEDLLKGLRIPDNMDKDKIRRVLGGLTEFDPRKRLSATEALRILDPKSRFSDV